MNIMPKKIQFSAKKNQNNAQKNQFSLLKDQKIRISANEIKNTVEKAQELTNVVNGSCSKRLCL